MTLPILRRAKEAYATSDRSAPLFEQHIQNQTNIQTQVNGVNVVGGSPIIHIHYDKDNNMVGSPKQEEEKSTPKNFQYFTPLAIEKKLTDELERAISAACRESFSAFTSCIDSFRQAGFVSFGYDGKKAIYDHVNELYGAAFSYDYFRHYYNL